MKSFSQRKGLKPFKSTLQLDSVDNDLRNGLWNALSGAYWDFMDSRARLARVPELELLITRIWASYFKNTIDAIPTYWHSINKELREYFFSCAWNEVYDFIEFVANNHPDEANNAEFMDTCNYILEMELSAYRFVGGLITQMTSETEIAAIEEAIQDTQPMKPVHNHLKRALDLLSDRKSPDYRNSIKESVSAVESMCNLITKSKDTLGDALKKVEAKVAIHPALKKGFGNIYGYTSDAGGIRHALLDEPNLDFEDAKYMLVSCSAFINYLISKAAKAGITF